MDIVPKMIILGIASGALPAIYKKGTVYIVNSVFCFVALFWMIVFIFQNGVYNYANNFAASVVHQNEIYMMLVLMSGVSLLSSQGAFGKEKIFHLLAGLAGLGAVILTQARGALLDILVLFPFFFFTSRISLKAKIQILFAVVLMSIAVLYVTNGFSGKMSRIFSEITLWMEGKGQATSIGARLSLWYAGLVDIFPHFPWMGTGVKEGQLGDLAKMVVLTARPGWTIDMLPHFHNDLVQILVKGGIFYTTAGIASLVLLTAKYKKHIIILWMIACALASGLTENFYFQPRVFIFFALILVLLDADIHKERQNPRVLAT